MASSDLSVSVVTPTFNSAEYLGGCIESIAKQSSPPIEHIVVDGGSSDDTVELLESSHTIWISEPDEGMYDAVNKGIRIATGEIVGYVNSDDRLNPETLELVNLAFSADSNVDFVFGYCTYVDQLDRKLATFRPSPFALRFRNKVRITFAQPTVFWRRRIHDEIGYFDSSLKTAADAEFFYRLLNGGYRGKLIKRPLARFMVRPDALSVASSELMSTEMESIRAANNVAASNMRYIVNELAFYSLNAIAYAKYFVNKRVRA